MSAGELQALIAEWEEKVPRGQDFERGNLEYKPEQQDYFYYFEHYLTNSFIWDKVEKTILKRYVAGDSVLAIAEDIGKSEGYVNRIIKKHEKNAFKAD